MNIQVRPGLLFDTDIIAQFQVAMAHETENGLQLDIETVKKGVLAVMDDPSKGKYWVVEFDNNLIGCLLTIPEWSDWRNAYVLWIHSVFVKKDFRGQGVFKKLYSHVKESVLSSNEYTGIRLYVDQSNNRAKKVYEKIGMSCDHYNLYEWMKP